MNLNSKAFTHEILKSKVPIAIIFTMQVQGLGITRSLIKENIPVLAVDHDKNNYGRFSKYVTAIISPSAEKDESAFIDFMINLGKNLTNKGVLFPTRDIELLVLSRYREVLEEYFFYPMAEHRIIERCVDKFKLYPATEKIGIPIPKTYFPKGLEEVKKIAGEIDYPYIIKPDTHEKFFEIFQKTALLANSKDELLKHYTRAAEEDLKIMVQEVIQGQAERLYTLGSYADKNSRLIGIFVAKKIRQYPSDFGTCRVAEPICQPEIIKLGRKLIEGLNYHGISQVEFKKDPKDEVFKLMEINARNWMWISLPTACGVNLPVIAYKDTIEKKEREPIYQNQAYVKWTYLDNDFKNCCLGRYKKSGHPEESLNICQWFWSIKGKKEYAIFSWRDPKPYIISNLTRVKKLLQQFLKKKTE
jgi:predicted ATP-grasp superfamily ATP-dependent carboligase